ncbi:hemolysin family protein [Nocardiopsis rhodophaea]
MVIAVLILLLGILVILAVIVANGYFVAQEFAYMSVDRSRLGAQAEAGDAAASRALAVTRRTSFMLSGAQLGITVTGLLVGYVAEPLVGESLGTLLGGVGVPSVVSITTGTVLALALSTVVQIIFAELYPKNLAIAAPEPLARRLARSTRIYLALFGWLIRVFDHAANALLRLVKVEPLHDVDTSATAKDLEHIVADARESGNLSEDLSLILERILDFPQHDVEHAMIPRSRASVVPADAALGDVRVLMAGGHSRYPVINDADEPVGVVHLVDVLASKTPEGAAVTAVMRPAAIMPTLISLPDALARMARDRHELVCVIDEYGTFRGILTIEDLAEEIVGEITDEHDSGRPVVVEPDEEGTWRVSGDAHIDEVERAIGHNLPAGDYETAAGMVIAELGALPAEGQRVRIDLPDDPADLVLDEPIHRWIEAEVVDVARMVPTAVRVWLHETPVPGPGNGQGRTDAAGGGTGTHRDDR